MLCLSLQTVDLGCSVSLLGLLEIVFGGPQDRNVIKHHLSRYLETATATLSFFSPLLFHLHLSIAVHNWFISVVVLTVSRFVLRVRHKWSAMEIRHQDVELSALHHSRGSLQG